VTEQRKKSDDKTDGLVILLHGGPGTGKTASVEAISELMRAPLIMLKPGDLGATADEVEHNLNKFFRFAQRWEAILLLDNADVFMEARASSDHQRNALVAVFLRALELYHGTLFLVTNRVGIFDEAFRSRIRLALYYENLTTLAREKIWRNMISSLSFEDNKLGLYGCLDKLDGLKLNGREIRNIFLNAKQLASHRSEPLHWRHVQHATEMTSKFTDYLLKARDLDLLT
jgi:SpoVK/Ycf46/Vps4 family AAA+-type ATPase